MRQLANDAAKTTEFAARPLPGRLLQRKCACGQHTTDSGQCRTCSKNVETVLQRSAINRQPVDDVPPLVHEVLRSPGQPLDRATRSFMESRFEQDFSRVRVHTDTRAAESARAVNALAYTVGRDLVFEAGRYAPQTNPGRELLAHELTHVVQQNADHAATVRMIGQANDSTEREADSVSASVMQDTAAPVIRHRSGTPGALRRQGLSKAEVLERIAENEARLNEPVSRTTEQLLELQKERNRLMAELARLEHPATVMPAKPKPQENKAPEPITIPVNVEYSVVGVIDMPTAAAGSPTGSPSQPAAPSAAKSVAPEQFAPGGLGAVGQSTMRFIDPLPGTEALGKSNIYTRYIGPSTSEGAAAFFEPGRLTMTGDVRPRLYQTASPQTLLEAEAAWKAARVKPTELNEVYRLLQKKGFQNLTAEEAALVRRVTYGHTQIAPAYQSSPLISLTELAPEEALKKLPPTATNRAYVVRVQIKPEDVGRVNEILKGSKDAARLSGEIEVVVAKNLAAESGKAGSGIKILSIKANPQGILGGAGGTILKWAGRGAIVIGAGLAAKEIVTATGPARRETQGKAFGSFAGATMAGAFAAGLCIGLGVATGGLAILGCGLLGGIAGGLGGGLLGGKIGSLFD